MAGVDFNVGEVVFLSVGDGYVFATWLTFYGYLDRLECTDFVSVVLREEDLRAYGFRGGVATASDLAVNLKGRRLSRFVDYLTWVDSAIRSTVEYNGYGMFYMCTRPVKIPKVYRRKWLGGVGRKPGLHVEETGDGVAVYFVEDRRGVVADVYAEIPWELDYDRALDCLDYYAVFWRDIESLIGGLLKTSGYDKRLAGHVLGALSTIELMLRTTYGTYEGWLEELRREGMKKVCDVKS